MGVPRRLSKEGLAALAEEGRANELRIARVRIFAYVTVTLVAVVYWVLGMRPASNLVVTGGAAAVAVGLLYAVKHYYRPWLRFLIPAFDAAMMGWMILRRMELSGVSSGIIATGAVASALFAATGGLRFDRWSAAWTTLLAVMTGGVLLSGHEDAATPYVLIAIIAVGTLSVWQTDLIRRIAGDEQGRAVLRRFLHRGVVERAFSDADMVTWAPRQQEATVLVSDLRGFTALAEGMDPPAVVDLLNELHAGASNAVAAEGGVVDKFMGDGMLAVFGAPEPLADHAACAVRAAIRMLQAVEELNARHPDRPPLKVGIGVHTGSVVSGVIGGGRKMEFTVIGDTVNTASRIESLTKEHKVSLLVSEETARESGAGPFVALGEAPVRGRRQPVRLCAPGEGFQARRAEAPRKAS